VGVGPGNGIRYEARRVGKFWGEGYRELDGLQFRHRRIIKPASIFEVAISSPQSQHIKHPTTQLVLYTIFDIDVYTLLSFLSLFSLTCVIWETFDILFLYSLGWDAGMERREIVCKKN